MALSDGAIAGIVVAVVALLGIVLGMAITVCRTVYRHEHGKVKRRRPSNEMIEKMRSKNSSSSLASGNTDFFVQKEEFNTMLAGLEESWERRGQMHYGTHDATVHVDDGAAVYSNPAFDSERGRTYEAVVTIQSWYRACRVRRHVAKRVAGSRSGRKSSVASVNLSSLPMYSVTTYGLVPTGGHRNTSNETLTKCLEQMHKRQSKKKKDNHPERLLRLFVTTKGLKVMAPDAWIIRHHVPLKDLYSFMVSPFSTDVFACIFRRKGITYCFAVSCTGDEAAVICKTLQEANLALTIHRLGSAKSNDGHDINGRRASHLSTDGTPASAGYLSGLGTPWTSGTNLGDYRGNAARLSTLSTNSARPVSNSMEKSPVWQAAVRIQCCYRSYRARKAMLGERARRNSKHRVSRSIELLSSLLLHPCMLCSLAPVAYDHGTDREVLLTALEHTGTSNPHRQVMACVSSKGITIMSSEFTGILHKIPLRFIRTYLVSPTDTAVFSLLFRTRVGSFCLVMKCPDAQLLCKTVHEAELASTLKQLEQAKANLPDGDESRGLRESASSIVANLPGSDFPAAGGGAGTYPGLGLDMAVPLPESVTITLKVESAIGKEGEPSSVLTSHSTTHHRGMSTSHSLSDVGSSSSMTAEAFAAAAHSLLDDTLKQTAQFITAEMSRSPSKEMDDIISDSTLKLLDSVDSSGGDGAVSAEEFAKSTPECQEAVAAGGGQQDGSGVEGGMDDTILSLMMV